MPSTSAVRATGSTSSTWVKDETSRPGDVVRVLGRNRLEVRLASRIGVSGGCASHCVRSAATRSAWVFGGASETLAEGSPGRERGVASAGGFDADRLSSTMPSMVALVRGRCHASGRHALRAVGGWSVRVVVRVGGAPELPQAFLEPGDLGLRLGQLRLQAQDALRGGECVPLVEQLP